MPKIIFGETCIDQKLLFNCLTPNIEKFKMVMELGWNRDGMAHFIENFNPETNFEQPSFKSIYDFEEQPKLATKSLNRIPQNKNSSGTFGNYQLNILPPRIEELFPNISILKTLA